MDIAPYTQPTFAEWDVAAFEHVMLADDRQGMPMTFSLRLVFAGALERTRFAAAARAAVARHPLLHARVRGDIGGRTAALRWVVEPESPVAIDWDDDRVPLPTWTKARLNLHEAPGLKIFVRQGAHQTIVTVQAHHAVTDALGAARWVEDLLALYNDQPALLIPLEVERLAARGMFHLSAADCRARLMRDIQRIVLFFRKFPQPILGSASGAARGGAELARAVPLTLSGSDLESLKASGRARSATVNDVLLRDLFVTLDRWNREHGGRAPIRLAMPISMRRLGDERMPVANVVSMCFLDRAPKELDDPEALLDGIAAETRFIKSHFMGHALIVVARVLGRVKGGLKALMTPRRPWHCSSTAVLSNLGAPFAQSRLPRDAQGRILVRGVPLTRCELLPPVRPNTPLALGVLAYAGEVNLSFHYDPGVLTAAEADQIKGLFGAVLRDSLSEVGEERAEFSQLLVKHAARTRLSTPFRGLPIGKNVHVEAPPLAPS